MQALCGAPAALAPARGAGQDVRQQQQQRGAAPAPPLQRSGLRGSGCRRPDVVAHAFLRAMRPWWKADKPPNVVEIKSIQQLVNELDAHKDQLVVVEFMASWCAGCKAIYPELLKLAAVDPSVRWLTVDYDENKPLGRGLGVKGLPHVLMYRGEQGQVESFNATLSKFQLLKDALAQHSGPRSPATSVPPLAAFPHVRPRHVGQAQPESVVVLSAPPPEGGSAPAAQPAAPSPAAAASHGLASNVVEITGQYFSEAAAANPASLSSA